MCRYVLIGMKGREVLKVMEDIEGGGRNNDFRQEYLPLPVVQRDICMEAQAIRKKYYVCAVLGDPKKAHPGSQNCIFLLFFKKDFNQKKMEAVSKAIP